MSFIYDNFTSSGILHWKAKVPGLGKQHVSPMLGARTLYPLYCKDDQINFEDDLYVTLLGYWSILWCLKYYYYQWHNQKSYPSSCNSSLHIPSSPGRSSISKGDDVIRALGGWSASYKKMSIVWVHLSNTSLKYTKRERIQSLTTGITLSNVSNRGSSSSCLIDKAILDFALFFANAKYDQLFHRNLIHDKAVQRLLFPYW